MLAWIILIIPFYYKIYWIIDTLLHTADVTLTSSKMLFSKHLDRVHNILYNNFNRFKCVIVMFWQKQKRTVKLLVYSSSLIAHELKNVATFSCQMKYSALLLDDTKVDKLQNSVSICS